MAVAIKSRFNDATRNVKRPVQRSTEIYRRYMGNGKSPRARWKLGYRGISAGISDAVSPRLFDNLRSTLHLYYRGSRRDDKSRSTVSRNSRELNRLIGRGEEKEDPPRPLRPTRDPLNPAALHFADYRLSVILHRRISIKSSRSEPRLVFLSRISESREYSAKFSDGKYTRFSLRVPPRLLAGL